MFVFLGRVCTAEGKQIGAYAVKDLGGPLVAIAGDLMLVQSVGDVDADRRHAFCFFRATIDT